MGGQDFGDDGGTDQSVPAVFVAVSSLPPVGSNVERAVRPGRWAWAWAWVWVWVWVLILLIALLALYRRVGGGSPHDDADALSEMPVEQLRTATRESIPG